MACFCRIFNLDVCFADMYDRRVPDCSEYFCIEYLRITIILLFLIFPSFLSHPPSLLVAAFRQNAALVD